MLKREHFREHFREPKGFAFKNLKGYLRILGVFLQVALRCFSFLTLATKK